jgi:hypothetical protein
MARDSLSDREGGAKSPGDLPLRLGDAAASPTMLIPGEVARESGMMSPANPI